MVLRSKLALVLLLVAAPSLAFAQQGALPKNGATYSAPDSNPNANAGATTFGKGWKHERAPLSLGDRHDVPITYRGVGNGDAFNEGFRPKGTNTNLLQHQMEKKPAGAGQSYYVSTSVDSAVGTRFVGIRHGGNGSVYDMQAPGGIDVNKALGDKSIYPKEAEIAIPGGVSPYDVRGRYDVKDGKVVGYTPNPDYHPAMINSDPIVAVDHHGVVYDKRTGRVLSPAEAKDAMERADAYRTPGSVALWRKDASGATGIDAGPLHDGRITLVEGDLGEVHLDALRLEGAAQARFGANRDGVVGGVYLKGQATLVGVGAQSRTFGFGDPEALTSATAQASGQAYLGAEAELDANAAITKHGVAANAHVGAFVGGKAEGDVVGQISICGVQLSAQGHGEVSYGIGGEADGYFKVDWSTMTVKVGGKAALTFGGGAGAGGEVEISLAKLLKDPRAAGRCALEGLKDAAGKGIDALSHGAQALVSGAGHALKHLCPWCHDDPKPAPPSRVAEAPAPVAGSNVGRNAPTATPPLRKIPRAPMTVHGPSHGAGVAR